MKYALKTGKRALSVFMAVLMLVLTLTVAVVAEEDPAEPATNKVTFINEYEISKHDLETGELVYEAKTLQETDVPEGEEVKFELSEPIRGADDAYGAYVFTGWVTRDGGVETPVEMPFTPTADTTLYAAFRGGYAVRFRNQNGQTLTVPGVDSQTGEPTEIYTQCLEPGQSPVFPQNPTMGNEIHYEYIFKKWVVRDGDEEIEVDENYVPTGDVTIIALYDYKGKTFHVVYYNYDGFKLGEEDVVYGEPAQHVPVPPVRDGGDEFVYSFENIWSTTIDGLENGGELVNVNSIDFYTDDNKHDVALYAQYKRMLISHYFTVEVVDEDRDPVAGAAIQVQGADGQLLTVFTDPSSGQMGGVGYTDEDGLITVAVPYQEKYTISAVYSRYNTAAVMEFDLNYIKNNPHFSMELHESSEYNGGRRRCRDICHTRVGGLWITGLNLFYKLFKVKYVCCYDMYATHGNRLAYKVGSKGKTVRGY